MTRADEGTAKAMSHDDTGRTAKCVTRGARQSYTRVEAQGVLIAAARPGPQCVATDNAGAVAKWNALLHLIRHGALHRFLRRRPWGLRADGDLWAAAAKLIKHKGPESIRVIWTKGHASEEDVRTGKSSEEHRRASDVADSLAGAAHALQPQEAATAHTHTRRHQVDSGTKGGACGSRLLTGSHHGTQCAAANQNG